MKNQEVKALREAIKCIMKLDENNLDDVLSEFSNMFDPARKLKVSEVGMNHHGFYEGRLSAFEDLLKILAGKVDLGSYLAEVKKKTAMRAREEDMEWARELDEKVSQMHRLSAVYTSMNKGWKGAQAKKTYNGGGYSG